MSKQKKILKLILDAFQLDINPEISRLKRQNCHAYIQLQYGRSLNKKDLVRRLLFEVVLSDDEIIKLLRIIFDKVK